MNTPSATLLNQWTRKAGIRLAEWTDTAYRFSALKRLGPKTTWQIGVQVVSSAAMKKLNKGYRGKDYATDVLSFPAPAVFYKKGILGELIICLPVLKRQARERKLALGRELDVLLVHGLLHLLGFDHELGEKEAARMMRWEEKLLATQTKRLKPSFGLIRRSSSGS